MTVLVLLEGAGGELDRRTADNDDEEAIREAVIDLATSCTLALGDTIRIVDASDGALDSSPATDMARG